MAKEKQIGIEKKTYEEWEKLWEAKRRPKKRLLTKEEFLKLKHRQLMMARLKSMVDGFAAIGKRISDNSRDTRGFEPKRD